jgi:beta-fructofuranosidase
MSLAFDDRWVWDSWLADDGATYHLFFLYAPRRLTDPNLRHRNARIGHAVSPDLVSWTEVGPVLETATEDAFDATATWTGSVVMGADGLWWMFYTGSRFISADDSRNIEAIGAATSSDLMTWTRWPALIVQAESEWYERLGDTEWDEEAWRDPWVFRDPMADGWHMLVTARANYGPDTLDRGVIGHATSTDLTDWTVQKPITEPGAGFAHLEVPNIAVVDGRSALLFSCFTDQLAGRRRRDGQLGGIWAMPFRPDLQGLDASDAYLLLPEQFYCGHVVTNRSGAPVLIAFETLDEAGNFAGKISDPMPVQWSDNGYLEVSSQT